MSACAFAMRAPLVVADGDAGAHRLQRLDGRRQTGVHPDADRAEPAGLAGRAAYSGSSRAQGGSFEESSSVEPHSDLLRKELVKAATVSNFYPVPPSNPYKTV